MSDEKFNWKQDVYRNRYGYLLVMPAVLCIVLLSLYPMVRGIAMSFQNYDLTRAASKSFGTFAGLDNYIKVFVSSIFQKSVWNTVVWTVFNLVFQVLFALVSALVLNETFKGRGLARTAAMIPWAIPSAVSALVFSALFDTNVGIVNTVLVGLHIIDAPVAWLGNISTAMPTVIIANIWKSTPFLMIFILASLQGVTHDMYESAAIDGAGKIKRFFYITLPSIKEPMAVAVILNAISILNNFNAIWLLTQGGPLYSTEIMYTHAYRLAFIEHKFGHASAISTLLFIVIFVLTVIYVKMISDDGGKKKKRG